jgi:hypothetical protein
MEPQGRRWARRGALARTTSPIVVTGQVSLVGMPPLITIKVRYGLQQRPRSGAHTCLDVLRTVVKDLRCAQADSVHAVTEQAPPRTGREKRRVLAALVWHAGLAFSDPETERVKDVWEWRCSRCTGG